MLTSFRFDSGPRGMPHMPVEVVSPSEINAGHTKNSNDDYNRDTVISTFIPVNAPTATSSLQRRAWASQPEVSAAAGAGEEGRGECNASSECSGVRPTVVSNSSCTGSIILPAITPSTDAPLQENPIINSGSHNAQSFADIVRSEGEWKQPQMSNEWKEAQRKRYINRFIGRKGVAVPSAECKFRAADIIGFRCLSTMLIMQRLLPILLNT